MTEEVTNPELTKEITTPALVEKAKPKEIPFVVHFKTGAYISVRVNAEDAYSALDLAYDHLPSGSLCAQCSGYNQNYSMDIGEEMEPEFARNEENGEETVLE